MTNEQLSDLITKLHNRQIALNIKPNSKLGKNMATEFMVGAMSVLDEIDPRVAIVITTGRIMTEEFKHLIKQ